MANEMKDEISRMMSGGDADADIEVDKNDEEDLGLENQGDGEDGEHEEEVDEGAEESEKEPTDAERYTNLLNEFNKQSAKLLELEERTPKPGESTPIQESVREPAKKIEPIQVSIAEEIFAKALVEEDPKLLADAINGALATIVNHFAEVVNEDRLKERLLLDMPAVAAKVAQDKFVLLNAVKDFYDKSPDLVSHMPTVGTIVNEITSRDPSLSLAQVLDEAEKTARKKLGIKKTIQQGDKTKPAFAKSSNTRKPGAPRVDGVAADIAEMHKATQR